MREILFRGKTPFSGEWVQGFYVHIPCGRGGAEEHLIQTIKPDGRIDAFYAVNPDTVGQYTGMTDKNDKKIFEGDILRAKVYETAIEDSSFWGKHKVRTGKRMTAVWSVEYKNFITKCGYFIYGKDRRFNRLLTTSVIINGECEVIGNIHDNPELLKGGADNDL